MTECDGCNNEFNDNELDDENLCEECIIDAGVNRREAYNDLD